MPVAVDTSVWVEFFGKPPSHLSERLKRLIEADAVVIPVPVELELILGARHHEKERLKKLLAVVRRLVPNDDTWDWCRDQAVLLRAHGVTPGAMDLLVAGLCVRNTGGMIPLWSLDHDFEALRRYSKLQMYQPQ